MYEIFKVAFLKKPHESRNKCDQREDNESKCIEAGLEEGGGIPAVEGITL